MDQKLSAISRIIAAIAALSLIGALYLPVWRIELSAPQYPEGLVLQIYADRLGGDVEVVNGLNHYIGMRTLHEKDFVEFQVLPYIIGILAFFGLLSALINRRWFYYTWVGFFILFAITAMIDFYRWEYNYGHNLDPAAPIQVPGMTYQPPLIGYKQLLNFGAYSIPDKGGWILFAVGLALVGISIYEIRKRRQYRPTRPMVLATAVVTGMLLFMSCNSGPQPIRFGSDGCDFCKMTITDKKFGAELVTKKGKVYKFDDLHCLSSFTSAGSFDKDQTQTIYLVDFPSDGQLIKADQSFLLQSENLRGPMGGNVAAFANLDSLQQFQRDFPGKQMSWNEVYK